LLLFSFGGYGLALAALALVVFGAIEYPPRLQANLVKFSREVWLSLFKLVFFSVLARGQRVENAKKRLWYCTFIYEERRKFCRISPNWRKTRVKTEQVFLEAEGATRMYGATCSPELLRVIFPNCTSSLAAPELPALATSNLCCIQDSDEPEIMPGNE